jgi:hypothetical protein
LEND